MHSHRQHSVTGPVGAAPAHSARPARPRVPWFVALVAVALIAAGLGISALHSTGGPTRSVPSSAHHLNDDATGSPTRHR